MQSRTLIQGHRGMNSNLVGLGNGERWCWQLLQKGRVWIGAHREGPGYRELNFNIPTGRQGA